MTEKHGNNYGFEFTKVCENMLIFNKCVYMTTQFIIYKFHAAIPLNFMVRFIIKKLHVWTVFTFNYYTVFT